MRFQTASEPNYVRLDSLQGGPERLLHKAASRKPSCNGELRILETPGP